MRLKWLGYAWKTEQTGVMPCLHVAVVCHDSVTSSPSKSSGSGFRSVSYEHHAILDLQRNLHIHVTTPGDHGMMRVVCTARHEFESSYSSPPRTVRRPSTIEQGMAILDRAYEKVDEFWEYGLFSNNCEHFVNQCWNPDQTPRSHQARRALAAAGGSSCIGAAGLGIPTSIVAATTTVPCVVGLSAAGIGVGAVAVPVGAYGIRQWVLADTERNNMLFPIAVVNKSNSLIKADLRTYGLKFPAFWDAVYGWRSFLKVGSTSCVLDCGMVKELNPPTVSDRGETRFTLHVACGDGAWFDVLKPLQVHRGDVVIVDDDGCSRQPSQTCLFCEDRLAHVLLEPCSHWEFCDTCIREWLKERQICPTCLRPIEDVAVVDFANYISSATSVRDI